MLIGNGMLANIFKKYQNSNDIIIYASGVSNSNENNDKSFLREKNLLEETINQHKNKLFVYFSSCSLENIELKDTPYHIHKLNMEQLIKKSSNNYLIFRLPNVVGTNGNTNNIVNFLFRNIYYNKYFTVWQGATRNIIDIEDVYKIASYIIDNKVFNNSTINIAYNRNTTILELVKVIETILNKKANYNISKKGVDMKIDNSLIQPIMEKLSISQPDLYTLLNKYKVVS